MNVHLLLLCLTLLIPPQQVRRTLDGLGDVLPRSTSQNPDHGFLSNAELRSDRSRAQLSLHCPDSSHIVLGDFGAGVSLTSGLSRFALTVYKIVNVGPDEQVSNIHTGWVVAGVKHLHPVRYLPPRQEPSYPVRLLDVAAQSEMPVALPVSRTKPQQTTMLVWRGDLHSKPLGQRLPTADSARALLGKNGIAVPRVVGAAVGDLLRKQGLTVPRVVFPHLREARIAIPSVVFTRVGGGLLTVPLVSAHTCLTITVEPRHVKRIIDADTFILFAVGVPPEERVRVLDINAYELTGGSDSTKALARAGRAFTATWLAQGNFTITACKRDSFGRLLATVTRGADTLAVALINAGHGVRP